MAICPGCWRDQALMPFPAPVGMQLCGQCTSQLVTYSRDGWSSEGGKHAMRLVKTWRAHHPAAASPAITPLVDNTRVILALNTIVSAVHVPAGVATLEGREATALLAYVEALEAIASTTNDGQSVLVRWRDAV